MTNDPLYLDSFFQMQCHECLLTVTVYFVLSVVCVLKLYQTLHVSIAPCFME